MNDRERFIKCLRGNQFDRFFRYELGAWPTTIKLWKEQGLPEDISFQEYFDLDRFELLPIQSGYTGSPFYPAFERKVVEENREWHIIRDTDGIVKKLFKENYDSSMPQFLKYPVENREDWEQIKGRLDPEKASELVGDLDQIAEEIGEEDRNFPVRLTACGAYGHPRNLLGDENLPYMLYDDPELIKEILQNWLELYQEILKLVSEKIEIDCFLIWEDMCFKNGPLISPDHFQKFMTPVYKELTEYARNVGVKSIWVDSDGDVSELIPLFVDCGVDALMPFEVQAGMDVVELRKEFGDNFAIIGGINKRELARDKKAIKKEVDRVVPFFKESGKYIPTLDHTVPPDVSLENFKFYLEYLRSYED